MSWFARDFTLVSPDAVPTAEGQSREIAPGVTVERRSLFKIGGAAALALLVGPSILRGEDRAAAPKSGDFGPLDLNAFTAEADALAKTLVANKPTNEEAYLLHLASLMCRLGPQPFGADKPRGMMRSHHHTPYFMVMQINMAPGAALPYHDHRDYNGVIMGLEGAVRARNFEIVGDNAIPPADESFKIRQTIETTLEPGRVSTLARARDNIHDLRAGTSGARLIDVFTFFPGSDGSHYLKVDETPLADNPGTFSARWQT